MGQIFLYLQCKKFPFKNRGLIILSHLTKVQQLNNLWSFLQYIIQALIMVFTGCEEFWHLVFSIN